MILLKIWRKKLEVMRSGSPESVSLGEIETLYAVLYGNAFSTRLGTQTDATVGVIVSSCLI